MRISVFTAKRDRGTYSLENLQTLPMTHCDLLSAVNEEMSVAFQDPISNSSFSKRKHSTQKSLTRMITEMRGELDKYDFKRALIGLKPVLITICP